jgi:Regulator of chromosome condensation (RCC1) repeat
MPLACARRPVHVPIGAPAVSIGAGEHFTCAVDTSGRAWCWGGTPEPTLVPLDIRLVSLSAGMDGVCGLTIENGIRCWQWKQVLTEGATTPSPLTNWTSVTVGAGHACALDTSGQAWCWGNDADGALGIGRNDHDKFVDVPPTTVIGDHVFRSIVTGATQTCGIDAQGELYCWGRVAPGVADDKCLNSNAIGGSNDCVTHPMRVHKNKRFDHLSIGAMHQCGITRSGEALCWGSNEAGQLGDGTLRKTVSLTTVRTLGITPAQARVLDARTRATWLAMRGWPYLLAIVVGIFALYHFWPNLRAWWNAGLPPAVASPGAIGLPATPPGRLGGPVALGAVVAGWLLFWSAWVSVATSDVHGEVGAGIAWMAILAAGGLALLLAAAAAVFAVLTIRRNRQAHAAMVALVLAMMTLFTGAVMAAKLFWPTER